MRPAVAYGVVAAAHLEASNVSQPAAACALGISRRTLARTLRGDRPILMVELERLSELVGVSASSFCRDAERVQAVLDEVAR